MTITAKFASTCQACNLPITVGQRVTWNPGQKASHVNCEQAFDENGAQVPSNVRSIPAPTNPVPQVGIYVLADEVYIGGASFAEGTPVKIQKSRTSGHLYAKVWNHAARAFDYSPGVIREDLRPMTLAEAEAFGAQYGVCVRCGRELTDPKSVARSMGPVCVKAFAPAFNGAAIRESLVVAGRGDLVTEDPSPRTVEID